MFEFYLAEKLSRTVEEIRQMDNGEFQQWGVYFALIAQQMELERMQAESRRR
jgi:hypothetical protein